jgi:hypothetical protein
MSPARNLTPQDLAALCKLSRQALSTLPLPVQAAVEARRAALAVRPGQRCTYEQIRALNEAQAAGAFDDLQPFEVFEVQPYGGRAITRFYGDARQFYRQFSHHRDSE